MRYHGLNVTNQLHLHKRVGLAQHPLMRDVSKLQFPCQGEAAPSDGDALVSQI